MGWLRGRGRECLPSSLYRASRRDGTRRMMAATTVHCELPLAPRCRLGQLGRAGQPEPRGKLPTLDECTGSEEGLRRSDPIPNHNCVAEFTPRGSAWPEPPSAEPYLPSACSAQPQARAHGRALGSQCWQPASAHAGTWGTGLDRLPGLRPRLPHTLLTPQARGHSRRRGATTQSPTSERTAPLTSPGSAMPSAAPRGAGGSRLPFSNDTGGTAGRS